MNRTTTSLLDVGQLQDDSPVQLTGTDGSNTRKIYRHFHIISLWQARSRQRRELRELVHHPELLKDVGLSIHDVRNEGRKPFWQK